MSSYIPEWVTERRREHRGELYDYAERGFPYPQTMVRLGKVEHNVDQDAVSDACSLVSSVNLLRWPEPIRAQIVAAREALYDAERAMAGRLWDLYHENENRRTR